MFEYSGNSGDIEHNSVRLSKRNRKFILTLIAALFIIFSYLFYYKLKESLVGYFAIVDQSNLSSVVSFYYDIGKPFQAKGKWDFMSSLTKNESTREDWEHGWNLGSSKDDCFDTSFSILGEEAMFGTQYARVSIVSSCPAIQCKLTYTNTWMKEQGKWRRLYLPKTDELANRKFSDGDYRGTILAAK